MTNQLFPPRLKLVSDTEQPSAANPATYQDPPQTAADTFAVPDATMPFKTGNLPGNFFGSPNPLASSTPTNEPWNNQSQPSAYNAPPASGFNPDTSNDNTQENTQPFALNNAFQPTNDQAGWPNQGSSNLGSGQLDYARGTTTGQLGSPTTGTLMQTMGEYSGNTGMLKLNQAVKVVRMPIAGRPGEFKTGILPILPQSQTGALPPSSNNISANKPKRNSKVIALVVLVFLILLGSGGYYLLHSTNASPTTATKPNSTSIANQNNNQAAATIAAQATATSVADASTILADPLSDQINSGWLTGHDTRSEATYTFKGGAYHIRPDDNSGNFFAYTYITPSGIPTSYTYNLTMQDVNYDTTNGYSFYGMIFNYKYYSADKATFYMFRVNNGANITYEFDKFDSRNVCDNCSPWQEIFPDKTSAGNGKGNGNEIKGKHGANAYSVIDKNGTFTLSVNGTKIGTVTDTSFAVGGIGMGVNQAKSEVAFSNLSILSN